MAVLVQRSTLQLPRTKWLCTQSNTVQRDYRPLQKRPLHLAVQQLHYCSVLDVQNSIQHCWYPSNQCSVNAVQSCDIRVLYHPAHQKVTTPSLAVLQYCQLWARGFNHRNGCARSRIGFSSNDDDDLQNLFRLFYDDILLGSSNINVWNCDGVYW